jgi:hypothetical protein
VSHDLGYDEVTNQKKGRLLKPSLRTLGRAIFNNLFWRHASRVFAVLALLPTRPVSKHARPLQVILEKYSSLAVVLTCAQIMPGAPTEGLFDFPCPSK